MNRHPTLGSLGTAARGRGCESASARDRPLESRAAPLRWEIRVALESQAAPLESLAVALAVLRREIRAAPLESQAAPPGSRARRADTVVLLPVPSWPPTGPSSADSATCP